jgi:uncharacterized membrane protein
MLHYLKIIYYFEKCISSPSVTTCTVDHLSINNSVLPYIATPSPTLFLYRSYVPLSVYSNISGTGTVVDWLLWNVLVLLISKCTAGDIN